MTKRYKVVFESTKWMIYKKYFDDVLIYGQRHENVYKLLIDCHHPIEHRFLSSTNDQSWLWHKRLGHVSM